MTKTQLNCFSAVLRTLSFTKAANLLYTSQPAISKNISKLEEELGCRLFQRSGSSLRVTEAGWILNDYLETLDREYRRMQEGIRRLNRDEGRTIRIGCPETWNPSHPCRILTELMTGLPGLHYTLESYRLSELLARLASGAFDAIITHDFFRHDFTAVPGPAACPVGETGCGILYSPEHYPEVSAPEQLAEEPFLVFDDEVGKIPKRFSEVIREACAEYGFSPRIRSLPQAATALFETANGKGVMFFSDWVASVSNPIYGYLPLKKRLTVVLSYYPGKLNRETAQLVEAARRRSGED